MPTPEIQKYLDDHGVQYETIDYEHAYDAQHVAASAHISGKHLAKTVVVKARDKLVMAVMPADTRVDCDRLREVLGAADADLAKEREFKAAFGDCEVGAMPPLGPLYGVDVFLDEALALGDQIAFRAGVHGELIRMSVADYDRIVSPRVLSLAHRR